MYVFPCVRSSTIILGLVKGLSPVATIYSFTAFMVFAGKSILNTKNSTRAITMSINTVIMSSDAYDYLIPFTFSAR